MKKNLFSAILGLTMILFTASCSKDNTPTPPPNTVTPAGKWNGTFQYGTTGGNPSYFFSLNLKVNGTVDVVGHNGAANDTGTGTWALVQDSIKVTYNYASSSAIYALSGKYATNSSLLVGTIGLSPATSGNGIFSVSKE